MRSIFLDTYAWIEYFRGTSEGKKVREYVENGRKVLTPSIVIAELHDKYVRNNIAENWRRRRHFIKLTSKVEKLDYRIAERAGELKWELREKHKDVGLADAIILSHALEAEARLLTGDKHLTHRENVTDISGD